MYKGASSLLSDLWAFAACHPPSLFHPISCHISSCPVKGKESLTGSNTFKQHFTTFSTQWIQGWFAVVIHSLTASNPAQLTFPRTAQMLHLTSIPFPVLQLVCNSNPLQLDKWKAKTSLSKTNTHISLICCSETTRTPLPSLPVCLILSVQEVMSAYSL